jgi:transcriptional regulator with XRE-family HTH domain
MQHFLTQLKKRRLSLGLKQKDMMLRIGISRQQYQQIESQGNPRLNTLELIAEGMDSQLMLIPNEKLNSVMAILEGEIPHQYISYNNSSKFNNEFLIEDNAYANDPWKDIFKNIE